jgi:hypothetical protein
MPHHLDVFHEACHAVGFKREAGTDIKFKAVYEADPRPWDKLAMGLKLTTFCHLVEVDHGGKKNFHSKLKTASNQQLLDALFIARNAFIHCNWDISKLNFPGQEARIRAFIGPTGYKHPSSELTMTLDGDIVQIGSLEPGCQILLRDI